MMPGHTTSTQEHSSAPVLGSVTHSTLAHQQVTVPREVLAQLLLHLADAYERFPTRRLRQAVLLTEHLLGLRD